MIAGTSEEIQKRIKTEGALAYVTGWYESLLSEIERAPYTEAEIEFLAHPVLYYGRYIDVRTRPYFERTVIPTIADAVTTLGSKEIETVLDLGCGLGMQSIMLAALGKSVVAVDIRPESIELCRKRKEFFEIELGRELDIEFVCGDFLQHDFTEYVGRVDGVFSMSAFSYIEPLEKTVALLDELTSESAKVFLFEENSSNIVARMFRRRHTPAPRTVAATFGQFGFDVDSLSGTCAIPKQAWRFESLNGVVTTLDKLLRRSLLLAFSYKIVMAR